MVLTNYNPHNFSIVSLSCSLPSCLTELIKVQLEAAYDERDIIIQKDTKIVRPGNFDRPLLRTFGSQYRAILSFVVDSAIEQHHDGEIVIKTTEVNAL